MHLWPQYTAWPEAIGADVEVVVHRLVALRIRAIGRVWRAELEGMAGVRGQAAGEGDMVLAGVQLRDRDSRRRCCTGIHQFHTVNEGVFPHARQIALVAVVADDTQRIQAGLGADH